MRVVVLGVGVLIAGLIVVFAVSERGRGSPPVPEYAPDFTGETLDGGSFNMAVQRGRWVVVNFFSTWCVECVVEHPELVAFYDRYQHDPDVELVSVVFRDDIETIAGFFAAQGGDWPVVVTNTGRVAIDFGVTAVPETYLVSPQGQVVAKFTGGVTSTQLEAELLRFGGVGA
ncbi:TlpA family protein disulfide reductase [Candidatus Poriferisocius sp.]|uniref:TlpA family protein disulfide reductase n=1 Tax=Candidatus Poriferisocius sp. TaxID=3101276 RepID=UPI003B026681